MRDVKVIDGQALREPIFHRAKGLLLSELRKHFVKLNSPVEPYWRDFVKADSRRISFNSEGRVQLFEWSQL